MMKKIFLLTASILLLFQLKSFVGAEAQKNLVLSAGKTHFLTFNEKIINYKFNKGKECRAEILTSIFGNRNEMLIKSTKPLNDRLVVVTDSGIYNFDINFNDNKIDSSDIEALDIDNPPAPDGKISGVSGYELDTPPAVRTDKHG